MIKLSDSRRVVVTGLGVVSSLGIGWQEFWKNLMAGKSGVSRITSFDTSPYDRHYAGEVKNFDPNKYMSPQKAAQLGCASQMAIAASKLALTDAGLTAKDISRVDSAVCIGTTTGEIQLLERLDDSRVAENNLQFKKKNIPVFPSSSLSANVAIELKLCGPNVVFATACSSGNYALGQAFDLIKNKRADFVLAGGADAFSRIVFTGFGRLFTMAPEKCQPFDINRKGIIVGEGAGIMILESLESAKKRKGKIYAEILGYGMSCDAEHMTIPSPNGIAQAIHRALKESGLRPQEIDYISAHGTGTVENDAAECQAAEKVFGDNLKKIPMSSIKSMLGHTMGAAAAFEAISCCLAIKEGEIPPTINVENQDPFCSVDCVANKGRKHNVETVLNNSQAFGGNNASTVMVNNKNV